MTLALTLPGLPPRELRGNTHGYTREAEFGARNAAVQWGSAAYYCIVDARNRCEEPEKWRHLEHAHMATTYVFPDNRRRDVDNYSGRAMKPVQDALVKAGVLIDDSFQHLSVSYDARVEKGQSLTIVEVTC